MQPRREPVHTDEPGLPDCASGLPPPEHQHEGV